MSSKGLFATCVCCIWESCWLFQPNQPPLSCFLSLIGVKVENFFCPALVNTLLPAFFHKKTDSLTAFYQAQVFMAQQCSPLALCHFKAKRWLAKNARKTWLRVSGEWNTGVFAPRPAVRVCLSNNAFLRIWKHEYEDWNWVSAVHSQLCRALEEQKKQFESKHLRKDWEWILIQHAH